MRADRRVNTRPRQLPLKKMIEQTIAHTKQFLQLEIARGIGTLGLRHLQNSRNTMGVVRGEHRKNPFLVFQQGIRTGQIGNIGIALARIDRIAGEPTYLRFLDFRIPIGAFHKPDLDSPPVRLSIFNQIINERQRAFLISLNGQPEPGPVRKIAPLKNTFKNPD